MVRLFLRLKGGLLRVDPPGLEIGPIGRPIVGPMAKVVFGWERYHRLADHFRCEDRGLWWKGYRYKFAAELGEVVAVLRAFAPVARRLPARPDEIVVIGELGPATLAAHAAAIMHPGSRILIRGGLPRLTPRRRRISALRRAAGRSRLAKAKRNRARPCVVLFQTEVQWVGGRDKDLWSVEKSLRDRGVDVFVAVAPGPDWTKNLAGLKGRPAHHLFTDPDPSAGPSGAATPPALIRPLTFVHEGWDFTPFVRWWMSSVPPRHLADLDGSWDRLMARLKPDFVVTAHEHAYDGVIRRLARKYKAKLCVVQHGVITDYHPLYILPTVARGKIMLPWRQFVYSDEESRLLTRRSIYDPRTIRAVGSPEWDALQRQRPGKAAFRFRDPIRLLFTTQPGFDARMGRKLLAELDPGRGGAHLRIRLHPGDTAVGEWRALARRYRGRAEISRQRRLDADLSWCDIHITFTSTCLLHAVIAGVPSILVGKYDELWRHQFISLGLAVNSRSGLKHAIDRWRRPKARESFTAGRTHYLKRAGIRLGLAGKRIADELILASKSLI